MLERRHDYTKALSHPALLHANLDSPPLSPLKPTKSFPILPQPLPIPDYPLLRSHHSFALQYVISKLRWEQTHNDYLPFQDAWGNHLRMISLLEDEFEAVEAAKSLDLFDNCFAPMAFPASHGPMTKDQWVETLRKREERDKEDNKKLERQYPFIKQLFIGPKTKQQARNDKILRDNLLEGDFDDISVLLPVENMELLMNGQRKQYARNGPRKSYEQVRMEREQVKIVKLLEGRVVPLQPRRGSAVKVAHGKEEKLIVNYGPMSREEWIATLPVAGPMTKGEALLPEQRAQRHVILSFLRKPWPSYDEEAAGLIAQLADLAARKMDQHTRK